MMIVGIDPGKNGGVVFLGRAETRVERMPAIQTFADWMESLSAWSRRRKEDGGKIVPVHAFVEKAQAMPKQGSVSMFTYGQGYGELLGVLVALQIRFTCVHPRSWTRQIHEGTKSSLDPKSRSLEACRRLFPEVELIPKGCRKPHEGIVDALLIAEYGRRIVAGSHCQPRVTPAS